MFHNYRILELLGVTLWQYGLTSAHIVCKQGNLGILKKILSAAKDQKVFCNKKNGQTSDYEVVLRTRAKEVLPNLFYPHTRGKSTLHAICIDHVTFIL